MIPKATILLDGAMGTELARRNFALTPPLFSARALLEAPELVEQIHADYIRAGAQVITTNSFGLHMSTLAQAGLAGRARELVERSVITIDRARQITARDDPKHEQGWAKIRIAGSLPPSRSSPRELAVAEQRTLASMLVDVGVDLLLLETHTSIAEVRDSLEAVAEFDLPIWLAVVAGAPTPTPTRPDGSRLLGGESFDALLECVEGVDALLINCTQIDAVPAALRALESACERRAFTAPLGLYPHVGRRSWDGTWHDRFIEPDTFAEQIQAWIRDRPAFELVGACCGSTPEYIAALMRRLQPDKDARQNTFVRLANLVP